MPKIIERIWFALGVIAVSVIVFFFRQFQYPAFNLIDDGYSLLISHELKEEYSIDNWQETLINRELEKGRLRPGYYLYYYLISLAGGDQPLMYWVFQSITLFGILALSFCFLHRVTKNVSLSAAASLIPLVFPSLLENFYRLGPAESRQLLWLLLSAFFMLQSIKSKTPQWYTAVLAVFFYLWALFTKETTLLALPALLVLPLSEWLSNWKKIKKSPAFHYQLALSLTLIFLSAMFFFLLPSGQGYSSGLSFDLLAAKANLFYVRAAFPEFHWLLFAGFLMLGRRVWEQRKKLASVKDTFIVPVFFAVLASAYLFFPLFWTHQLERYYLLGQLFVWIFFVMEVVRLHQEYAAQKLHFRLLAILALVMIGISYVVFLPSRLSLRNLAERSHINRQVWHEQYQYSYALIKYLQEHIQPGMEVFVAFNDYEVIYEIGLFASDFYKNAVTVLSENELAASNFNESYQLVEDSSRAFAESMTPSVLVGRENPPEDSQFLWPADNSLRDDTLVWFIVSNNK